MTADHPRLLHVGNVLVDVVMYLPTLPEPGGDVLADESAITVGGGLNVLVAAVRAGLPAAYGGLHGTGPFGDLCRAALAEHGVAVLQPPLADQDTGFTVAMVDPSGERTFATGPGAEARLDAARLATLSVRPTDVVHVSGYGLAYPVNGPALAGWLSTLDSKVTVIVDPGPLVADIPAPVLDAVLARADWWSCNEREARFPGAGRVGTVVRTGAGGCVLHMGNAQVSVPPFAVDAVDTNGAGDTHVGVFAAGLAAGLDPTTAALRANAAAALAVTKRGPSTAPTAAEVDDLLVSHD
ncbi:MAG TPA: PfkB family carbohydrate kinase [Pseudonocardiaceae bacterium]